MPTDDPYRTCVQGHARELLEAARARGPLFAPLVVAVEGADVAVTVVISAGGARPDLPCPLPELTECEHDIVAVLRGRPGRETTGRVLRLLDLAGLLHGETTVKHALARLVRLGVLSSSRRAPRGYRLAPQYLPVPASSGPVGLGRDVGAPRCGCACCRARPDAASDGSASGGTVAVHEEDRP